MSRTVCTRRMQWRSCSRCALMLAVYHVVPQCRRCVDRYFVTASLIDSMEETLTALVPNEVR